MKIEGIKLDGKVFFGDLVTGETFVMAESLFIKISTGIAGAVPVAVDLLTGLARGVPDTREIRRVLVTIKAEEME